MSLRGPPEERSPAELLSFGVVNLDKPPGPSSHQVSAWIRDAVVETLEAAGNGVLESTGDGSLEESEDGAEPTAGDGPEPTDDDAVTVDRAAHAGTLDPKVTGCLPVMLGDATRLAQVFLEGPKEYVAVLECHGPVPGDLEDVVGEFEGPIYQKPPRKSAVARRLRVREIYDLSVLETRERQVLLRIRCESGTYVRKLCHDLGLALGTGAHMGHLRRTATHPFDDASLSTMAELYDALAFWTEDGDPAPLREVVVPAERALEGLPGVWIHESAAREVANGAPVYAPGVFEADDAEEGALVACYTPADAAVCLGRLVGDPDAASGAVVDLERVLV